MSLGAAPSATGGRRERKKAHTRALISDAATRLFLERGFDEVTVKEVAEAADVSPTTVFAHFPTKESLVFDEEPEHEASLVAAVRDRPPGSAVLDALEAYFAAGLTLRRRDDPAFGAFLDMIRRTPVLREHERRLLRRRESVLADAIADSSTPDTTPTAAAAVARFVLDAVDLARDSPDPHRVLVEALAIVRYGWSGR